jgi:GntR family transcriptional repressor for pyruvate dehydrogenase complex
MESGGRPVPLEKIQYVSPKVPELVMQTLIGAIESGHIQVGRELPAERVLAEQLGVGRGSLRECLAILEFLGAIECSGNRKKVARDADYIRWATSFVQISHQMNPREDFNEFRRINEAAIAELACQRATEKDMADLAQAVARLDEKPDDPMGDVCFHDALAMAGHNMMLAATIHLVNSMIADVRKMFFKNPDYIRRSQESHRAIYEAVRDKDTERARREMELHLDIVEDFAKKYPEVWKDIR